MRNEDTTLLGSLDQACHTWDFLCACSMSRPGRCFAPLLRSSLPPVKRHTEVIPEVTKTLNTKAHFGQTANCSQLLPPGGISSCSVHPQRLFCGARHQEDSLKGYISWKGSRMEWNHFQPEERRSTPSRRDWISTFHLFCCTSTTLPTTTSPISPLYLEHLMRE